MLLHFGHFGSSSDSITYIRHRGHPTSIIDVASGLLEYLTLPTVISSSDDTHELGGDVGDTVADRLGDSTPLFALGGDRFNFSSSFGAAAAPPPPPPLFLRFIFSSNLHKSKTKTKMGYFGMESSHANKQKKKF